MAGQTEVIEHIAMPVTHGFQKRFNLVFMPEQSLQMDSPLVETASTYIMSAHSWLFNHGMQEEDVHYLDGYATTIYKVVQSVVEEWQTSEEVENAVHLKYCKIKLRCWSTDILRLAHANMRISQYTADTYSRNIQVAKRNEPNAYEFLLALHMWLRQFHIHTGFYRWCMKVQKKEGPTRTLASVIVQPESRLALKKSNLEKKDRLKHEILILKEFKPGQVLASDTTRDRLRNTLFYKNNGLSSKDIMTAFDELIDAGLILKKEADGVPKKKVERLHSTKSSFLK